MRNPLWLLLLLLACSAAALPPTLPPAPTPPPARELALARDMLADAVIRNDEEGMRLARERLERVGDDRDAHYWIAIATMFEAVSGWRDAAATAQLYAIGTKHIDRALEIDPKFADGWMISAMLHKRDMERAKHAIELDPKAPAVSFFTAFMRSFNPNGGAPPEGVKAFDELAARVDDPLWLAEARIWQVLVRVASDDPRPEILRPMSAKLTAEYPQCAGAKQIAAAVAEHQFVAAPKVAWKPFLVDAAGDGKNEKLPDIVSVDRADDGDRAWFRVTFHDPLPRSFGVNLVVNRSGDQTKGMKWWGKDSTFQFDRLVTTWISRDGDHYFGRIGVTDEDGARTAHPAKLSSDVLMAMSDDNRSVMIGVKRDDLGLTDKSAIVVAGGSHLVWNDDATIAANSR